MDTFLDSSLFRIIYCNVASASDNCAARGYSDGFCRMDCSGSLSW